MRLAALFVFSLAAACGSSSSSTEPAEPTGPTPEEKLRMAQADMCGRLCPKLTECAARDAEENQPPEKVAELTKPEILEANTNECINNCELGTFSPRQVSVANECLSTHEGCPGLLDCLDAAAPKNEGASGQR